MEIKDIKKLRLRLGYTQLDVALAIGISRQTYNRYEQNPEVMPLGIYKAVIDEFIRADSVRNGGLIFGATEESES